MDKKVKKIVGAMSVGVVLLGAGLAVGHSFGVDSTSDKIASLQKEVMDTKSALLAEQSKPATVVEKIVEVKVPVEKNITKEVLVDNKNLDKVLQFLYDEEGNIEYVTSDLKEKEMGLIVDRIVLVNDFKSMAVSKVSSDAFDELDNEVVNGSTLNDRKMSRLRIYDDFVDVKLEDVDFDNKDARAYVDAKFEDDDVEYKATFEIVFKDGEIDDFKVDSVSKI